jgi:Zn-finger nucleic acid-binding protein
MTFTCLHCGTTELPQTHLNGFDLGDPAGIECPGCGGPLHHANVSGRQVCACAACGGSLSPMSTFGSLIDAIRFVEGPVLEALPPRTQEPGQRTVNCPKCGKPMRSHLYGGGGNVVIDTCETCLHNWLDGGELRRIALAPR